MHDSDAANFSERALVGADNEDNTVGEVTEVFELYKSKGEDWSTIKPFTRSKIDIPRSNALIVRWQQHDSTLEWEIHSLTVQSPYLRNVLRKLFEDYPGVNTELKDLVFKAPFLELFFRWQKLRDLTAHETGRTAEHCRLLLETLEDRLQPPFERSTDLQKHGVIDFEHLWTLFEPQSEVYVEIKEQHHLLLVASSSVGRDVAGLFYSVQAKAADFDGKKLGVNTIKCKIRSFAGVKTITDLAIHPSAHRKDTTILREQLTERGRKFLGFCQFQYCQYSGFYFQHGQFVGGQKSEKSEPMQQFLARGRVIIDATSFARYNSQDMPVLEPISTLTAYAQNEEQDSNINHRGAIRLHRQRAQQNSSVADIDDDSKIYPPELADDLIVYCVSHVKGFNLANKQWASFSVDHLQPIDWSSQAFSKLLLREDYKKMVLAFLKTHARPEDRFEDIIQGKGQSFVMLLSGEPGVGKTLTAESVAEEMRRPLYMLSAGELGSNTTEIEKSLQIILQLCVHWNAVLLIDECDVFLEQRTVTDLERNRLVAVFLRLLEYYQGILILTTNRASVIDAAFMSRIHLSIVYPNLDPVSRRKIWETFTRYSPPSASSSAVEGITAEQLDELAQISLNGRQIKNAARSARLLAESEDTTLSFRHVDVVLNVQRQIDEVKSA